MAVEALKLDNVKKNFAGTEIIRGLNLSVAQDERHAVIGPNGAGKSTAYNLITGRYQVSSGKVFLKGEEITNLQPYEVKRKGLSRSFQITNIFPKMSVFENVRCSLLWAMGYKYSFWHMVGKQSKLNEDAEKIIEEYAKTNKLPFTILRYGSVYSEKSFSNNYIYKLISEALKTSKINHGGDGSELREYIHALDAASLSCDILEKELHKGAYYIVTGNAKIKRIDLFKMINEILGNKLEIKCFDNSYENHYKLTPYSFQPTMCKKLTPNPHIELGQGLLRCIQEISKL